MNKRIGSAPIKHWQRRISAVVERLGFTSAFHRSLLAAIILLILTMLTVILIVAMLKRFAARKLKNITNRVIDVEKSEEDSAHFLNMARVDIPTLETQMLCVDQHMSGMKSKMSTYDEKIHELQAALEASQCYTTTESAQPRFDDTNRASDRHSTEL